MKTTQIELTNQQVGTALRCLERLGSAELEFNISYTMGLNQKTLREALKHSLECRREIAVDHCELNEQGEPKTTEDQMDYIYLSPEDEAAATQKFTKLDETAISLHLYTYPRSMLSKAKVSHNLWEHLTWMVHKEAERPAAKKKSSS